MLIKRIDPQNTTQLQNCRTLASENYLDNLVLLGDLYNPCLKLSRIFGIFDETNNIQNFFVIFDGFTMPSIVLPVKMDKQHLTLVKDFLITILPEEFFILTLELVEDDLSSHFKINYCSVDNCMIVKDKQKLLLAVTPVKKSTDKDLERIDKFYFDTKANPWNPIQFESGYYHYIEDEGKIVACGGTHFENPKLAQIGNIYVLKDYRRRGFGELLTSAIAREILDKKELATLFVNQENIPAKNLYQKLGFELFKPARLFFCNRKLEEI